MGRITQWGPNVNPRKGGSAEGWRARTSVTYFEDHSTECGKVH
jgi:hypothetical protein